MLTKSHINVDKKLNNLKMWKKYHLLLVGFLLNHIKVVQIQNFKKTQIANIILNFKDRKKLIADLESGWKIGPEEAQQRIGHDSILLFPIV